MGIIQHNVVTSAATSGSTSVLSGHGGHLFVQADVNTYFSFGATTTLTSANSFMIDAATGEQFRDFELKPEITRMYYGATSSGMLRMLEAF